MLLVTSGRDVAHEGTSPITVRCISLRPAGVVAVTRTFRRQLEVALVGLSSGDHLSLSGR